MKRKEIEEIISKLQDESQRGVALGWKENDFGPRGKFKGLKPNELTLKIFSRIDGSHKELIKDLIQQDEFIREVKGLDIMTETEEFLRELIVVKVFNTEGEELQERALAKNDSWWRDLEALTFNSDYLSKVAQKVIDQINTGYTDEEFITTIEELLKRPCRKSSDVKVWKSEQDKEFIEFIKKEHRLSDFCINEITSSLEGRDDSRVITYKETWDSKEKAEPRIGFLTSSRIVSRGVDVEEIEVEKIQAWERANKLLGPENPIENYEEIHPYILLVPTIKDLVSKGFTQKAIQTILTLRFEEVIQDAEGSGSWREYDYNDMWWVVKNNQWIVNNFDKEEIRERGAHRVKEYFDPTFSLKMFDKIPHSIYELLRKSGGRTQQVTNILENANVLDIA